MFAEPYERLSIDVVVRSTSLDDAEVSICESIDSWSIKIQAVLN